MTMEGWSKAPPRIKKAHMDRRPIPIKKGGWEGYLDFAYQTVKTNRGKGD